MGLKCHPKQKPQREHFFLLERQKGSLSLVKGAKIPAHNCGTLCGSCAGTSTVPLSGWGGKSSQRKDRPALSHIILSLLTLLIFSLIPVLPEAAWMWHKAFSCCKVLTALVWRFLGAAPSTAPLILTFGFLLFYFFPPTSLQNPFFLFSHLTAQCLSDTDRHCWVSLAPMLTHSAPCVALWLVWSSMQEHTLKTRIPALTNTRFIKLNHRP